MLAIPTPASADDVVDVCSRILHREALRLERKRSLTKDEIDLVVRVARGAAELIQLQLDPLGARGRKRLQAMTDEELQEARRRLEQRS
jgi:hypothetical protein